MVLTLFVAFSERDNFFLKQARKRDSEKPSKSQRKTDEQQEQERLSSENGEERSRRKDRRPLQRPELVQVTLTREVSVVSK